MAEVVKNSYTILTNGNKGNTEDIDMYKVVNAAINAAVKEHNAKSQKSTKCGKLQATLSTGQ